MAMTFPPAVRHHFGRYWCEDNMTDTHDDQSPPAPELSTDPFIQRVYERYAALIAGTGVVTTDDFFAKNPDQVLADLSLLFGYIRGLESRR
jgi:hypothetical protein